VPFQERTNVAFSRSNRSSDLFYGATFAAHFQNQLPISFAGRILSLHILDYGLRGMWSQA
jgi:hypothetical protein